MRDPNLISESRLYVAGFLFCSPSYKIDAYATSVALITKSTPDSTFPPIALRRPRCHSGETTRQAMAREFKEETGQLIAPERWEHFATLLGDDSTSKRGGAPPGRFAVVFFRALTEARLMLRTDNDEVPEWYRLDHLQYARGQREAGLVLPNLHWLIPMALNPCGAQGRIDWPFTVIERDHEGAAHALAGA